MTTGSARAPNQAVRIYRVGDLRVYVGQQRVTREGADIPLTKLSFELLLTLIRAAPDISSNDELMSSVWPGLVVSPETVSQRIKLLRNALDDDPRDPRYIAVLRGRGYRLVAPVADATLERPDRIVQTDAGSAVLQSVSPNGYASETPSAPHAAATSPHPDVHAGIPTTGSAAVSFPSVTPQSPRRAKWVPLGWIGGTLIIVALLAASSAIIYYRGESKRAERVSSGGAAAIQSLAVLPLENLSGDKEQEYFADGMTDALITDLAQLSSLRVISRTSTMRFKGSKDALPQIGRELKVDAVVEGTVARAASRVRITAQLIEASSDHHLWAKSYERDLKDVLALQDEIAQDITEQIRVKLTPKERSLLTQSHAVDPEAYDAYLRGAYWMDHQLTLEDSNKACDYFQKAMAKDPKYALAYVGVAWCQLGTPDKARETLAKALALDPSLAEAHAMLSHMKFDYDWDWAGTEAELKQAIALNPNSALAHSWYSFYLVAMARLDEATREIERARDLDPYSSWVTFWLGQVLYHARRYDDALRQNRRGLDMYPDNASFYDAMADVYEQRKLFAEAFAARQQALSLQKDPRVTALAEAYKRAGYKGYLLAQAGQTCPLCAAHFYALADDEPRAIAALEAAYKQHDSHIQFMRTAPEFDSIRSSPGFRDLLRRLGSPQPSSDKN